jgi:hypothetical protein
MTKSARLATLAFVASAALLAQYPGQAPAPIPSGQPGEPQTNYPPGAYPGPPLETGVPTVSGRKKSKKADLSQPTISADGLTVSNDGKKLVVATKDGRFLTMSVTPQTKFTRSGGDIASSKIVPRTTVHVDAAEDDEAFLTAVNVDLVKDAPVQTASAAPRSAAGGATDSSDEDMAQPTILKNPVNVPDRPVLHHGKPKKSESDDSTDDVQLASNRRPAKPASTNGDTDFTIDSDAPAARPNSHSEALIDKTKDWAMTFSNGLPNYVCDQLTTRYMERSRSTGWEPLDVITAKVVYEDGKEDYRDITVGGKKTNKGMMELGGSTSTGEFASTLRSLFSSPTDAEFKLYESTSVGGNAASIYDFKVALRNSDWTIQIGGQMMRPAYSGSVWIDKATGEVRRIEMQADNIPHDFPLDSIQMAVDYEKIRLGTNEFLLPVHAENLACQRGSPICTKNAIDFRDYHKFTGESTIEFK